MKVRILGSGAAQGIPRPGCDCKVCCSDDKKNVRTRPSIIIESDEGFILVDMSPDLRYQLLDYVRDTNADLSRCMGIIVTHFHADHTHGIDDVRSINCVKNNVVNIYSDPITMKELKMRFEYAFRPINVNRNWDRCCVSANEKTGFEDFTVGDIVVQLLLQYHGCILTNGILFNNKVAYCTDFKVFHPWSIKALQSTSLELLILDCLRYTDSFSHNSFEEAIQIVKLIKPKKAILNHLSHVFDYNELLLKCQDTGFNVEPGYDGMVIEID